MKLKFFHAFDDNNNAIGVYSGYDAKMTAKKILSIAMKSRIEMTIFLKENNDTKLHKLYVFQGTRKMLDEPRKITFVSPQGSEVVSVMSYISIRRISCRDKNLKSQFKDKDHDDAYFIKNISKKIEIINDVVEINI